MCLFHMMELCDLFATGFQEDESHRIKKESNY